MENDKNRTRGWRRYKTFATKKWARKQIEEDVFEHDVLFNLTGRHYRYRKSQTFDYQAIQRYYYRNEGKRHRPCGWEYEWNASGHSWKTQLDRMNDELKEFLLPWGCWEQHWDNIRWIEGCECCHNNMGERSWGY